MSQYSYQCFDCRHQFSSEDIESANFYLCPDCGAAHKNRPLKGVLQIIYDYPRLKKTMSRENFLKLPPGRIWLYPNLWPLKQGTDKSGFSGIDNQQLSKICLSGQPVLEFKINGENLLLMDETRNPTLSFKDRASTLVVLKAIQSGVKEIAAASTGNAGSSLAGICARLGLKSFLFVPKNIPAAKRIQMQSFGAQVCVVDGDYDRAFDLSLEISGARGWYNRNTAFNPLTIEGKKSAAYDIFLATKGHLPDYIFIPVGDGVILSGIFKGFWELLQLGWIERIPVLIAVQASGSDALVRYLESGTFDYQPAQTIADSIHAGAPRNLYMVAHAVKKSKGRALRITDGDILESQKQIARETGILAEPAAAAGLSGYLKMKEDIPSPAKSLILITGNGLKDIKALEGWNLPPVVLSPEKWKEFFQSKKPDSI